MNSYQHAGSGWQEIKPVLDPNQNHEPMKFTWSDIEKRCVPVPESGCFLWLNMPSNRGYPVIKYKDRNYSAHRIAWEITNGPIPEGMCVMHMCDTPTCVNPGHLRLGSHLENMMDRQLKGRTTGARRRKGWSPFPNRNKPKKEMIINDERAKEIRHSTLPYREIARLYGISLSYVGMIKTNKVRVNK